MNISGCTAEFLLLNGSHSVDTNGFVASVGLFERTYSYSFRKLFPHPTIVFTLGLITVLFNVSNINTLAITTGVTTESCFAIIGATFGGSAYYAPDCGGNWNRVATVPNTQHVRDSTPTSISVTVNF